MDHVRDMVAAGGVSMVLAQDRDRFSREPAYTYLLRREFEEYGAKLKALNDRGGESPEGELTDGILDQLAKFERAKTSERSRRGKLQKARSGKVVGGHPVNYGFRFNESRDGYVVDEERMPVVRRIFRMVGEEGLSITAVARTLNAEGISGPTGGHWNTKGVHDFILEDVYRPHTCEEVAALVAPEVAARLDPERRYGVWWWGRERWQRRKVSEPHPSGSGRVYRWKVSTIAKPREEWVAVPVPDAGIPRETAEAARHIVSNNVACYSSGDRFWELSGGVLHCSDGARRMRTSVTRKRDGKRYFYYSCPKRRDGRVFPSCTNRKLQRAERAETLVWRLVSDLLTDPERVRIGLEEMIEREREGSRGDPEREARIWLERLAEVEAERRGYLRLAARGSITDSELDEVLSDLEQTRQTAESELVALRNRQETIEVLERDRDALMESYAGMLPEALERLGPEERHNVYRMLRLEVAAHPDGALEAWGTLSGTLRLACENGRPVCNGEPARSRTRV
jgi:site-specific DNA recombinase